MQEQPPASPSQPPAGAPPAGSPPAPPAGPPPLPPAVAPPAPQPPVAASWATPPVVDGPAPGVRYAAHGARFLAWLVDGFILGFLLFAFWFATGWVVIVLSSSGSDAAAALSGFVVVLASIVLGLGYMPWFWARGGQTPGMKMLHVRVVRAVDGGPVSGGQAFIRLIGYYISGAVFYLGFIWILFDARRQGWHDKIAATVVIDA
jgi:uncharacterized RDD family membrane protein YckC